MRKTQILPVDGLPDVGAFYGADPDCHHLSFARIQKGYVPSILLFNIPGKVKAINCVPEFAKLMDMTDPDEPTPGLAAVEAMDVGYTGKTNNARKQDLPNLNLVAGAMAFCIQSLINVETKLVLPRQWKGTVPKDVHQARICTAMGWHFEKTGKSIVPLNAGYVCTRITTKGVEKNHRMLKGEWKHVLDSIGLALYAAECYRKEQCST